MYIINEKEWDEDTIYKCNGIIANWLIYEKHLPLFAQDKGTNSYYFAKTEALEKSLAEMPFYYNIVKLFI